MLHYVITLSVLILAVILIRAIFRKKIPPAVVYAMWLAVVIRMCIPMPLLKMDLPVLFEAGIEESVPSGDTPEITDDENPGVNHGTVDDGKENPGYVTEDVGGVTEPYIPEQGGTVTEIIPSAPTPNETPSYTPGDSPNDSPNYTTDDLSVDLPNDFPAEVVPNTPAEVIPDVEMPIADTESIDVPRILRVVWIAGSAVMAAVMLISAAVFQYRAQKDRQLFKTIHKTKVYISGNIGGPCLAGLIPSIYLTPENAYSSSCTLTMIHEYTHLRHGDYIWSAVRALALIAHWWNPLVWVAAILSRHDAELAVDATITKKLNNEKRLEYARIIVDTIPVRGVHAIGLGSGQIKERILMITGSQKNRIIAVVLALVICFGAIGCAFVGRSGGETESELESETETESDIEDETNPIETTDPEDETDPAEDEVPTIDVAQYFKVLENNVGLEFSSIVIPKNDFISCCYFDEEHILVSTYDVERDENNEIECYSDFTLYLINTMRGTLEDFVVLGDMSYRPISKNYTENGLILSDWHLDDDGNMVILGAILVSQQGGRLSVVPDNTEIYPRHDSRLKSPDGRYTVFDTTDDGTGHGGIDVVYPNGTTKRILTNVMEGDPGVTSLGDVTGYSPIQFIDNERLLYHIGGWEWTQGYGIYNLATGEKTEFREGYAAMGYWYGAIFLTKSRGYETVEWYMDTLEGGERRLLASVDEVGDESVFHVTSPADFRFAGTNWRTIYSPNQVSSVLNKEQLEINLYHLDIRKHYPDEEPNILAKVHYDTSEAEIYAISHDNRETTLIFVDGAPMPEKAAGDTPLVNVLENNAGLDINTVFLPVYKDGGYMDAIKFDEQHMLYITYEVAKNEETGKYYKTKPHFYLIDILNGEIIDDYPYYALSDSEDLSLFEVDYTDDGIIFMEMGNLGDRLGVMKAYRLTYDGALKFTPVVRIELYPYNSSKIVSPTGEYVVYGRDEGGYGDGGIDIVYAGGAKYRFLNNVTLDNAEGSLSAVTYYSPVGFADNSHLVYSIGGYEHIKGFGIYDLATGENKMFDDGKYQLSIVGDGIVSFEEVRRNDEGLPEQYRTWTMTLDGTMTLTASVDEADGVPTMPENISNRLRSEPIYSFTSRSFKVVPDYFYKTVSYVVESIYSPDMKEKLAVIEYPSDSNQRAVRNIHFVDNSVTIVLPVDPAALSTGSEDTPLVNVISNPGGLDVQTVYIPTYINDRSAYANIFEFDERYVICVTYDDSYNNATLYVIDTSLGQVIHEEALTEYGTWGSLTYIDSSVVLLNYYIEEAENRYRRSTEIRIENGAVQVIEGLADYVEYPRCEGQVKSPDGRYTAYNVLDDEAYHGGVDLLYPDGTIKRIKENEVILMGEGVESDVYGCISRYSPLGFMDDKHLVIILGGYESPSGYEIYNVETGEFTQGLARERVDDYYNIEYSPATIIDGYLYLYVWKDGQGSHDEEIIGVGKIDLDGNFTMLAHRDETDGVFVLTEDEYFTIHNEVWHMYDSRFNAWSMKLDEFFKSTGYRVTKKFYSADFEFLLELEYPYFTLKAIDDVYVYGDTCTVITFTTREKPAVESPTNTTQDGGKIYFTSDRQSFIPPEASGLIGSLKTGNSDIFTYSTDADELCVYCSYGLDAESFVMLKTEFESPEIQTYYRSELVDHPIIGDGTTKALVRYYHYGVSCYTDVTYELDPSLYIASGEPNEERVYRTPVWKIVDSKFTLHEGAVASTITGKNGSLEFWHRFMNSNRYLYFITLRGEGGIPIKFYLHHFDASQAIEGLDLISLEIPEDVEYDTIKPINYITGGGSMECRFYLELTKNGEVFYIAFDNFHWETGDDILDFRYQGIVPDSEIAELHKNNPDLFLDPENSKIPTDSGTNTTQDVFRSILENKEKFRWGTGDAYFADLIDTRTVASDYTIIDLDGKGEAELVVSLKGVISHYDAGTLIFHREDDYTICHYIGPAYFVGLMADGSFQWSGDSGSGFAKLDFSGDSFTWIILMRRVVVDYPEINYYINEKPVTDVEYDKYYTDLLRGKYPSWITLDYSREDSDEKAIESILSNKMPIRVVARGENMLLSDYREYSGYAVKKYTIFDLDKDGGFELVLWLGFENSPYSYAYLVLHRDGDIWYAHSFTARSFNCLKGNGQYTSSSSAFNMTLLEIDFEGDSYTEIKVAERTGTGTEESIEYYVGGERASKDEFEKIYDRYDRISQPTWYSLDPDTVDDIENWRDIFAVWYPEDGSNPAPRIYELIDELVNAKSRIHEINELGISDYTIALMMESEYDAEVRLTFTVTGNSLPETLPPGTYTWTIYEGYDIDVTDYGDIPNPDAVPSYADRTRGMEKFGDYSAARAVNTFLQWNRYSDEFCPYGEWENNAEYTYPYDYICVYYGDDSYTITFDDLAALMDEKFGITVTRPERDGAILSRCRYDAAYDTVSYADTRGSFRPAHKIIDVVVDGDVTYVTVQLYAESLYLIPSHKVRYTIGDGDVFLSSEIIKRGNYEPRELG